MRVLERHPTATGVGVDPDAGLAGARAANADGLPGRSWS